MMPLDEMIAVLQAAKARKKIQFRPTFGHQTELHWSDFDPEGTHISTTWNFNTCDFRVKPEPRELWLQEAGTGIWQEKFKGFGTRFREVLE